MFWIPIVVIVLVIWYFNTAVDAVKTSNYKREYQSRRDAAQRFSDLTRDEDLEQHLRWDFEDWKIDCNAVVREFMGGNPKWDQYTGGNAYGKEKAKMALMAQQGKFPGLMSSFKPGMINPAVRLTNSELRDMNVEYLLRLQNTLRQRLGRNVVLYVTIYDYSVHPIRTETKRLQDCLASDDRELIGGMSNYEFRID